MKQYSFYCNENLNITHYHFFFDHYNALTKSRFRYWHRLWFYKKKMPQLQYTVSILNNIYRWHHQFDYMRIFFSRQFQLKFNSRFDTARRLKISLCWKNDLSSTIFRKIIAPTRRGDLPAPEEHRGRPLNGRCLRRPIRRTASEHIPP